MANQEQNPPQQEQPFVAAKKDFFKCVSDFTSKCCLKEPFTRSPNMYKEYLAEFWYSAKTLKNSKVSFFVPTGGIYGEVRINTFMNAIGAHYLPHSIEYVTPPSIDIVRPWFETIRYGETIPVKGTLKKSLLPPNLGNGININYASIFWEDIIIKLNKRHREKVVPYTRFLSLFMMHKIKEGYGDAEPVVFKAPKPSSNAKRVPQGTKCWELYILDLVPLDSAYTISIHSQCFSIVNLYLYKLAITLSRLQRSVYNSMAGSQDDIPPPPPPSQTPTQQTPHTVSTIKLPILKKGEYDIWAMKMEHYLAHTDYPIWEVIQNGNGPVSISTDTQGQIKVLPPRTAEEILARERERKARTTLLMALPEDHLAKFHKMTDAKRWWKAIKSNLVEMKKSRRCRKYYSKATVLKLLCVSTEDANQKFLRSLNFCQVTSSTASSSSTQNVAFVSENTSSTNDVSTAYGVSNPSGHNSQYEQTSSYSLLANQSSCPQLDHEDLEQLDEFDLEEMDLKWKVALISMRMKKFYKKTGHFARECRTKGNQDSKRRDAWNSGNKDKENGRRSGKQEDSKALVTIDGEGVDWTSHSEEEEDYALMACNSSGSDTERAQLSDASIEIQAYTQALKKVEAQLVAHQQGQLWYEQKIKFMKIDLDDKTDVLTYHKKLLAEVVKEKEDLKAKVEKWHNSSKNLGKLLNTQMSANDKFGLGYGDHRYDGILSYENEVLQSVFMNKESDLENQPLYDKFVTAEGMHVVPSPMTGNYMPSGPDIEIDYSQFTYGPK
ncbi:hypothetical protein Tco_0948974 [Tanacetum coccineum]